MDGMMFFCRFFSLGAVEKRKIAWFFWFCGENKFVAGIKDDAPSLFWPDAQEAESADKSSSVTHQAMVMIYLL